MLYPSWLNPGDNAWQLTAATFVGLMSVPGLVVLYGGVMQKRWSVNSMMLTFSRSRSCSSLGAVRLQDGLRHPWHSRRSRSRLLRELHRRAGRGAERPRPAGTGQDPLIGRVDFPTSTLVYFQLVFAAITPILMLGSMLGRVNFKAWLPFVLLWTTFIYTVNAFLIWGGGWFGAAGRRRLQRRLRHPPGRRRVGLRRRVGDRAAPGARPRDRRAEQPGDGRHGRRAALARLERLQRRRSVLRRRRLRRGRAEHERRDRGGVSGLGRVGLRPAASRP